VASSVLVEPPAEERLSHGGGSRGGIPFGGGGGNGGSNGDGALPVGNARMAMVLALIVSTMLFSGMIGALIVLRGAVEVWPPAGTPPLPVQFTVNTFVIVASSVLLVVAHVAQRRGNLKLAKAGLLGTTACGVAFLLLQWSTWHDLIASRFLPKTNNYGGNFYLLTGTHFAHVVAGLLLLLYATTKAVRGTPARRLSTAMDLAAMGWHFVDVAWLVIFALLRA
jgi:heme/copper-type cytochrome/quinol oxidase subunit 3